LIEATVQADEVRRPIQRLGEVTVTNKAILEDVVIELLIILQGVIIQLILHGESRETTPMLGLDEVIRKKELIHQEERILLE